ncbi:MAG: S9 family peptidase [Chitinophagaceae bacterium]|nr:S9 family peptidase [Chitinophagaceae bacterium]
MTNNKLLLFCMLFVVAQNTKAQFNYPATKEIPVVDDYFGTKVTDNYRWLEDLKDTGVQQWFKAQSEFTDTVISRIKGRDILYNRMKEMQKMVGDIFGVIHQNKNTFFYVKVERGGNLGKLYYRSLPAGKEELLFDPEAYGKGTELINFVVDDPGNKIAMSLSKDGAEVCEIRILDVKTKKLLTDSIEPVWSEFSFEFTQNSNAVLYTKMNSTDNSSDDLLKNMKVCLHTIGTKAENDRVIVSREHNTELGILPEQFPAVTFSDDKKYIFLDIGSVKNEKMVYYAPGSEFSRAKIAWKSLIKFDDEITGYCSIGNQLFFLSHKNAPNFKIGVTDLQNPDFENAKIIVPESKEVIRSIQKTKSYIFYSLSNGINQYKYQINPTGFIIKKLPLPEGINGSAPFNPGQNDRLIVYNNSWLSPYTLYEYDAIKSTVVKSVWFDMNGKIPDYKKDFTVEEVEVRSYDGTMVPLSVIYPKNIQLDGHTPCYLTGYGGYGISIQPNFIASMAAFLEQGCCIAFAHVRGGGEKGEEWHKGGMKSTKPNTWKDFIACAAYLVDKKFTSPQKLIGNGMSAGGILIGRAITERPDLFAVAIDEVGVTNALRMEVTPNGANQIPELGSIQNEEDARYLLGMDAQSKVKKGVKYPAVFVRSGMNDPRVVPWMPGKFAATLQNNSASGKPVLLYVNYNNGHFTSDIDVTFKELSDMLAFSLWQVGHPNFERSNQ